MVNGGEGERKRGGEVRCGVRYTNASVAGELVAANPPLSTQTGLRFRDWNM